MYRMNTKELRNADKTARRDFDRSKSSFFEVVEFGNIEIEAFRKDNRWLLRVYRGTASKPTQYNSYQKIEGPCGLLSGIDSAVQQEEAHLKYKADLKERNGGKQALTGAALCAKRIRSELAKAFPAIKFSVTSKSYSGGDSVHVSWTDGPTSEQVDRIAGKYEAGHFDGMTDMYEYCDRVQEVTASGKIETRPDAKYVMTNRHISTHFFVETAKEYGLTVTISDRWDWVGCTHEEQRRIEHETRGKSF